MRKHWWALLALKTGALIVYVFGGFFLWFCLIYGLEWSPGWSAIAVIVALPFLIKDDYENRNSKLAKIVFYPLKRYSSRD